MSSPQLLNPQCMAQSIGPGNHLATVLIQTILAAHCAISPSEMWPKDYGPKALKYGLEPYDFIVVGGGTAGSVVASRLSENPNHKVLLLEAGRDPPMESEIPNLYETLVNTTVDWSFISDPESTSGLAQRKGIIISRGKLLGGNSGINNMVYIRGKPKDFDYWKNCGNPTWGWEDVLKYFKKSEKNRVGPIAMNTQYHSTDGPMPVDLFRSNDLAKILYMDAAFEQGFPELLDINANKFIGVIQAQGTLDYNTRSSTAKSFLRSARNRKNLHVIKNANVVKVKYNPDGEVCGVIFVLKGKTLFAESKKEVVISAGPINTPKILLLSGIGPEEHLKNIQIKVRQNLPVGRNFHDHVTVPVFVKVPRSRQETDYMGDIVNDGFSYFVQRQGHLSSIGVRDLHTFMSTQGKPHPNIQITYRYYRRNDPELLGILTNLGYDDDIVDEICKANILYDIGVMYVSLLTPISRGYVELRSKDPFRSPRIIPNFLAQPNDLEKLIDGIQCARRFLTTKTAEIYHAKELRFNIPGCSKYSYDSPKYWQCYARHMSISGKQPVGTVKMGPDCDEESVVDWRLRVYNVKNLRVIDPAIMPRIVRAPTYATNVMIAEKGAEFLIEDWKSSSGY